MISFEQGKPRSTQSFFGGNIGGAMRLLIKFSSVKWNNVLYFFFPLPPPGGSWFLFFHFFKKNKIFSPPTIFLKFFFIILHIHIFLKSFQLFPSISISPFIYSILFFIILIVYNCSYFQGMNFWKFYENEKNEICLNSTDNFKIWRQVE